MTAKTPTLFSVREICVNLRARSGIQSTHTRLLESTLIRVGNAESFPRERALPGYAEKPHKARGSCLSTSRKRRSWNISSM
jgi:hypothetical protein